MTKLRDIDAVIGPAVPRADLPYRQHQIAKRVELFARRATETAPDALPR